MLAADRARAQAQIGERGRAYLTRCARLRSGASAWPAGRTVGLRDDNALKGLLGVAHFLDGLLDLDRHRSVEGHVAHVRVVEEAARRRAWLERRSVSEFAAVKRLERLAEDVRRRVPEDLVPLSVIKFVKLEFAVALKRPSHIPQFPPRFFGRRASLGAVFAVGVDDRRTESREPFRILYARDTRRLGEAAGDTLGNRKR